MSIHEIMHSKAPYPLARMYEIALLENDARLRVIKLVELYEYVLRYLGLVGLAEYHFLNLADEKVESARGYLGKPSLGHWLALVRKVDEALEKVGRGLLTPRPNASIVQG